MELTEFVRISVSEHGDSFGEHVQVTMLHGENPVVRLRLGESGKLCRSMVTIFWKGCVFGQAEEWRRRETAQDVLQRSCSLKVLQLQGILFRFLQEILSYLQSLGALLTKMLRRMASSER